ncbi:MAG: iron export ABC transporter permease subunit FetB [Gammaproteobacteria bacterium]|nr:iron export ABC transporter permease subunit FetB [Gammaproteobacteria bacterium]
MIDDISLLTLAFASSLVLANGLLSFFLQLGLGRQLLVAALRMIVQLFLVGWILTALFSQVSLWLTLLVALVMLMFAGYEIRSRQKRRFTGHWGFSLGISAMLVSAFVVTVLALTAFLPADPWYHPRFAIPLLGMILGNTMTGISLGLNTLTTGAQRDVAGIEAQLTLGASMKTAMRPVSRDALRTGLMPIVNAMAATGVVSLPGMMTGQILSGVEPAVAVKYQLLIMFLIAGATALGVLIAVFIGMYRLTDERQRLRLDRLDVE